MKPTIEALKDEVAKEFYATNDLTHLKYSVELSAWLNNPCWMNLIFDWKLRLWPVVCERYASLACQKTLDKDFIKWIFINYEYIPPLDRYAERTQEARVPHFDIEDLLNIYKKVVLP